MSAIFGILRFDDGEVSASELERMGNTLAHRGPDGRKFVAKGPVGLGHCLMRVNQEDLFERQPLIDRERDLILVADCRIDNREELADAFGLSAADTRDMPDSAFILRAYKKWGEDCAEHLIGDYAFAVWDGRKKKLVLGRDHMGQRWFYYHRGENFFAFATEIKGLWALAEVPRKLLDEEIARFFCREIVQRPERKTFYAGISGAPGGTISVIGPDGSFASRRYWEPRSDPTHEGRAECYYIEKYREVLEEAVACRMRRLTGPAALMMSGGFDTAAIAGLAGPTVTAQGRKLITLSWLGSTAIAGEHGDMRPWLEACRRAMPHLDMREVWPKGESPFAAIENRFSIADAPAHIHHKTFFYLAAEAAAAGAHLIMDGFGGDYTLNPRGHGVLARHLRRGQLRRFLAEVRPHMRQTGQSAWQTLKGEILVPLLPHSLIRWQRQLRGIARFSWKRDGMRGLGTPYLRELQRRYEADATLPARSIPVTALRERMRCAAAAMVRGGAPGWSVPAGAFGLDLTRPFHDKRVVELGLAIPEDFYVKYGVNRYIARLALADVYPPEFRTRGRKNEGGLGDLAATVDAAIPELLREVERLAKNRELSAYFDFERARRRLSPAPSSARSPSLREQAVALEAVLTARFIEWFGGTNAR
jgi:asparagine synthase (glutamine-hydrolysing)